MSERVELLLEGGSLLFPDPTLLSPDRQGREEPLLRNGSVALADGKIDMMVRPAEMMPRTSFLSASQRRTS